MTGCRRRPAAGFLSPVGIAVVWRLFVSGVRGVKKTDFGAWIGEGRVFGTLRVYDRHSAVQDTFCVH